MADYKRINDRADIRFKELHDLGFRYITIEQYKISIWQKKYPNSQHTYTISTGHVMFCEEEYWQDLLKDLRNVQSL